MNQNIDTQLNIEEDNNLNSVVYSPAVIEFVTVANEYCRYIESISSYNRESFTLHTQKVLPLLYLKISLIPEIPDNDLDYAEKFVSEDDYTFILKKIQELLKDLDIYQEVFNKDMAFSDEALDASIAEDLTDIYQDLKDFIISYQIGAVEGMTSSLKECVDSFRQHWGQCLVNSMRAVHNLIYSDVELKDSEYAD